jgi:hypothetical protein
MLLSLHARHTLWLYHDAYHRPGPGVDFLAIYHAGHQIRAGKDPYAYHPERRPPDMPMYAPFRYLPGVASSLGVAVSHLDPRSAYRLWLVLLELVLIVDLVLLQAAIPERRWRALLRAGWLLFTPLYLEFWMGQFTLVAASLLMWTVLAWESGRRRLAAVTWGAASLLKLIGFALLPWLLRRRQFLVLAVGVALLAWSAVWFVQHPASWHAFALQNLGFTQLDFIEFHAGNLGLQSFLFHVALLFGIPSVQTWSWVAVLLPTLLGGAATWAMWRMPSPRTGIILALLLLPLAFKHVWEHHYVALLPALALLWEPWAASRRHRVFLGVCFVLLALPTPFALQPGTPGTDPEWIWSAEWRLLHHAVKPLVALVLFGMVVVEALKPSSGARRESTAPVRSASSG